MLTFLSSFTDSFVLALLLWPFAAFLLTLPILIIQYRRFNKLMLRRALSIYLFVFYCLGLVCFTLYPMPADAATFCREYHLSPQLNPLQFVGDIQTDGLRALLQIIMNFVFFVPLGVFGRMLFRWRFRTILAVGFATSLFIETAQLTGGFGLYPCGYRLFDVDDLVINTFGAVVGYGAALVIPQKELVTAKKDAVIHQAGLVRHAIAFFLDAASSIVATVTVLSVLYFVIGKDATIAVRDVILPIVVVVLYGIIPYSVNGWSLGGVMVRLNHDDIPRHGVRRIIYYSARAMVAVILLALPDEWRLAAFFMTVAILMLWWKKTKLPHQYI